MNKKKQNDILAGLASLEEDTNLTNASPLPTSPKDATEQEIIFQSAFGRNTSKIYSLEAGETCPKCNHGKLEEVPSFAGKACEFFVYCPICNTYVCNYQPMPHQAAFHKDDATFKLYAGGFGSAKTYTCGMEFIGNMLQIPNSAGLIGAKTWGQIGDTCLKFVTENIPQALVAKSNQDKVNWSIELKNGSKISAKAFDKEGKMRSMNLSCIWIEEASEVDFEIVAYLKARLRNKAGFHKGKNRLRMLVSSNPDVGWLNSEWLMKSGHIYYHGDVADRYQVPKEDQDPKTSTHISATSANTYLPADYEENLARNKEPWWVNRYLKGSFKYSEGLVYPNFSDWFVEPFEIPAHWKRITGTDFGRRDPTAHLVAALDPVNKIIYVYDELEESLDDRDIKYIADKIKAKNSYHPTLLAYPHQADPRGRNRDQVSGNSWIQGYFEQGITFAIAEGCEGDSVAPTITKVYNYGKYGRLKIFNNCSLLRRSLSRYRYPKRDLSEQNNQGEKPLDRDNHLPDALRYMLAPFPQFPESPAAWSDVWNEVMQRYSVKYNPLSLFEDNYAENDFISDNLDNFG